jgi:hypothetical protein
MKSSAGHMAAASTAAAFVRVRRTRGIAARTSTRVPPGVTPRVTPRVTPAHSAWTPATSVAYAMVAERMARVSTVCASATKATAEACAKLSLTTARRLWRWTAGLTAAALTAAATARTDTPDQPANRPNDRAVLTTAPPAPATTTPPPPSTTSSVIVVVDAAVATDTRRTTTSRTLCRESTATRAVMTFAALTITSHSTSDADHRPVWNAYQHCVVKKKERKKKRPVPPSCSLALARAALAPRSLRLRLLPRRARLRGPCRLLSRGGVLSCAPPSCHRPVNGRAWRGGGRRL